MKTLIQENYQIEKKHERFVAFLLAEKKQEKQGKKGKKTGCIITGKTEISLQNQDR